MNGSTFDNGQGTHAASRVVFARPEGCTAFYADVGLDDEVGDQGTVVFEGYGEGKLLATSGLVFATDEPVPLSADVSQVGRVALVVTPGGTETPSIMRIGLMRGWIAPRLRGARRARRATSVSPR